MPVFIKHGEMNPYIFKSTYFLDGSQVVVVKGLWQQAELDIYI
jgi:hypothetical protein